MLIRENANYLKIQNTKAWKAADNRGESEGKRNNRKTKKQDKKIGFGLFGFGCISGKFSRMILV